MTPQSRRKFFREIAGGVGNIALAELFANSGLTAANVNPLASKQGHFKGKAKSVIFMFMEGGPSQADLFDPKPGLQKWHGKPLPESMTKQMQLAFIKPTAAVLASPRVFTPHGKCGTEFSDYIPHTAARADDTASTGSRTRAFRRTSP